MPNFKGLFALTTPRDLLEKMRHDLSRMEANPLDSYAAFDFFVAAEHIAEWCKPGDERSARKGAVRSGADEAALGVTKRLANGGKHFQVTKTPRPTVGGAIVNPPVFQPGVFQADAFQTRPFLSIALNGSDQAALGQASITPVDLARRVLAIWEAYVP